MTHQNTTRREYTKCLNCGSIFPTVLELKKPDAEPVCPVCGDGGIVNAADIDIEMISELGDALAEALRGIVYGPGLCGSERWRTACLLNAVCQAKEVLNKYEEAKNE